MRHQYLVVDQNFLRTAALRNVLVERPNVQLVLPDLAMLEMTKPDERELTVALSLETIARYPGRLFVSRAMSECLKYELTTGRSVAGHLLFRPATAFLRTVLLAVESGIPNDQYRRVIDDPENHLSALKRAYLNHTENKSRSLELLAETKRQMSIEFAKRVRASRATREEWIDFVRTKALSLLAGVLQDNGFSLERAMAFIRTRPMLVRYFYLKVWTCLVWEEQGRLEGLGAKKVSNDLLDHEYVLAATFFDGVPSDEPKVNDAYGAVTLLLETRV